MRLVDESANSSYKYLQNIYANTSVDEQSLSIALAVSENFIRMKGKGGCRVHGGGFAGTIQTFLPNELSTEYVVMISRIFGKNSVYSINIRSEGPFKVY